MRAYILSTGLAAALGVFAMGPANAAPIATHGVIAAPAVTSDVACRTVKKTVIRNGVRRVTTTRECTRGPVVRERVYGARRYYGPRRYDSAPGISIRVR